MDLLQQLLLLPTVYYIHTSHTFIVCFKHTGWPHPSHLLFTLPMLSFFTLCPTPWVLSRQILHLLGILSFGGGGWLSGSFSPMNFIIDDFSVIVTPPCSMTCICGAKREFTNNHPKSKLLNPLIELFASYTVGEFMRAMSRTYDIATIVQFLVLGLRCVRCHSLVKYIYPPPPPPPSLYSHTLCRLAA